MPHSGLLMAVSLLAFGGAPEVCTAGIPIIWGSGETASEIGELPPEAAREVEKELGGPVSVAFVFERLHVYYLDLWTWNGQHVVHAGNKYWKPDAKEWQDMIGGDPSARYGKPLRYRIPVLPAMIAVVAVGYAVRKRYFKTDEEKLAALMNDKRYERAVEAIFGNPGDGEADVFIPVFDEQKFADAKRQLMAEGVDADKAEANLRQIVAVMLDTVDSQVAACMQYASQLEREGELDKSAEVYAQVILALPDGDSRKDRARSRLTSVIEKRKAIAAEQGEPGSPAKESTR